MKEIRFKKTTKFRVGQKLSYLVTMHSKNKEKIIKWLVWKEAKGFHFSS